MLGRTHALSGATAWASLTCAAPLVGVHPRWPAIAVGLLATAGAALLPDADHVDATIAWSLGPVTKALTRFVHRVSGGHRHATHSIGFTGALPLAVWAGGVMLGRWFALAILFLLFTFGLRALHLARGLAPAVALGLTALVGSTMPHDLGWLPYSVGAGIAAHLAGDCLTKEGCPLLWPHKIHYMIPAIQRTGNRLETLVVAPVCMIGTVALLVFAR
jgi:membrane-bound metal-dependent hydrolase YbcI (DUF457 family)